MRKCQNCGVENIDESVFCRRCGTEIEEINPFVCTKCEFENTEDSLFCIKCGTKLLVEEANGAIPVANIDVSPISGVPVVPADSIPLESDTVVQNNNEIVNDKKDTTVQNNIGKFDYNTFMNQSNFATSQEEPVQNVTVQPVQPVTMAQQPAAAQQTTQNVFAQQPVQAKPAEAVSMLGNSVGNIVNEGVAAREGEWIFYSNSDDRGT